MSNKEVDQYRGKDTERYTELRGAPVLRAFDPAVCERGAGSGFGGRRLFFAKGNTVQIGGMSGNAFSAICGVQILRLTSSKPSEFALASDEKFICLPTTSFVRCCLKDRLGTEVTSWVCMACAAPCVLLGFIRIQGQTFEQFVRTWVESEIMFPSVLVCRCENLYYEVIQRRREGQIPEIKPAPENKRGKGKPQKQPVPNVRKQDGFDLYQAPNIYKFRRRGKGM